MKKFLPKLSIVFLILLANCAAQKNDDNIKEVIYKAHTRGSSMSVTIVNNNVFYKTRKDSITKSINKDQRNNMVAEITKINLEGIRDLIAPSKKRTFDAALHATVSIKSGDKTYTSSNFDHGNPPAELKALVDLLLSFKE
ncbi:hypothetical protein OD91_1700 [Lutibacter sp. Hel_I_33_5]|uniref:hypothetical protein n=1 Tax=Lutibacter sp. Hel_I_33_5 TaxID=1566289 RepID=UPI0011A567D1|nr:hypothetical protein [Lutibacter sp. Hel_I_33_5]TVZ56415.1 hypothetical protein OD91_1700 [Lutibacter sp. Hel_I_33_5]